METQTSKASRPAPRGTLHERFHDQAAANPAVPALIHAGRVITYSMLDIASDAYAAQLADAGIAAGDQVPLLARRSAETIAAIIGILKCGAAYTMLDSRWPEKRLRKILDQLRAPLTVTDNAQKWYGPAVSLPSASLFELPGLGRSGASPSAVESDPCTIFFTSGTTGDAKGVIAPHRGIVELFGDCDFADFGTGVVMPQAAPQPWGGFALELWSVLLNGGTSVLIDQPYLFPGTLRTLVQKYGVNSVYLTPALFNLFVDEDLESFRGVRQVLSGGERMSPVHAGKFLAKYPEVRLMHTFGSVESPLLTTAHHVRPSDCGDTVPIGHALRSRQVYLLEGERQCGPGEIGEICVAADGIALGYLDDPALTAEKFQLMRLGDQRKRVFRSGDYAHYDGAGVLFFDGRSDGLVKFRGLRIELAGIERVTLSVAGVSRCVALYRPGQESAREAVILFFTANGEQLIDELDLRRKLELELPAYTIPQRIHRVEDIPLTWNGKLDSAALFAVDDRFQRDRNP